MRQLRPLLPLITLCILIATSQTGCTRCTGSDAEKAKENLIDTIILDGDTLIVHPNDSTEKGWQPTDSINIIDSIPYKPIRVKTSKIAHKANPAPTIDTSHIVNDSVGRRYIDNRLCVIIKSQSASSSVLDKWERQFKTLYPDSQYYVAYKEPFALVMQIAVPADQREALKKSLPSQIKGVKFMVVDEELSRPSGGYTPNDPVFNLDILHTMGYDWYFDMIQAKEAWSVSKGSDKIVVAIVDDYFDLNHPELNSYNIVDPYSVERGNRDVYPPEDTDCEHGTMVASLAIGKMDNKRGACGIAPNCKFMPISLGGHEITTTSVVIGLLRAIHGGADVVNISLGWAANFTEAGMSIKDQIKWSRRNLKEEEEFWNYIYEVAAARNVIVVYAAGNERDYIAVDAKKRSNNIVCVSSVNMDGEWSYKFSNVGNFPQYDAHASTLSAPGEFMFGALPNNSYQIDLTFSRGTSYAAPLVTGAIALMKSVDNSLTVREIIDILQRTGKPATGFGGQTIGNIIQIGDALNEVQKTLSCFNDFVRNPIGLWGDIQQSKCYKVINEYTGEIGSYSGQMRAYFRIKSVDGYGACGEEIVCQVTDEKRLVHWEMKDKIYIDLDRRFLWKEGIAQYKKVESIYDIHNNSALYVSSYHDDGHLSDGRKHGFWGANKMKFCKGPNGTLVVYTWDKWGGINLHTLKRYKRIKREYKSEL